MSTASDHALDQPTRLHRAMIHLVREPGYQQLRVEDLAGHAQVATSTFYEHFQSKEDCFVATFDWIVAPLLSHLHEPGGHPEHWSKQPERSLRELFDAVAREPEKAFLLLVASLGAGPAAHARANDLRAELATVMRTMLTRPPRKAAMAELTAQAVVGGLVLLTVRYLRDRNHDRLARHSRDLAHWAIDTLRLPEPVTRRASDPQPPRVRATRRVAPLPVLEDPSAEQIARERILEASTTLAARHGYAKLTSAGIAEAAGLPLQTFEHHYPGGAHEAFLAAFDRAHQRLTSAAAVGLMSARDWPGAVHAALAALCDFLAAEPHQARVFLVEILTAGTDGLQRSDISLLGLSAMLQPGYTHNPRRRPPPPITAEATGAATAMLLYNHALNNDATEDHEQLLAHLTCIALAPFIGARQAAWIASQPPPRGVDRE